MLFFAAALGSDVDAMAAATVLGGLVQPNVRKCSPSLVHRQTSRPTPVQVTSQPCSSTTVAFTTERPPCAHHSAQSSISTLCCEACSWTLYTITMPAASHTKAVKATPPSGSCKAKVVMWPRL